MADGGRHQSGNNSGDASWSDLDWLEEDPEPAPRRRQGTAGQQTARQRPAQTQRQIDWQEEQPPRRQQTARQGSAPQSRPQQRPAQPQQRASQPQQRASQPQRRPVQQQSQQSSRQRRYVEVEPEDYRPKRRHRTSVPLVILIVVLVGGIIFAGVKLGSALLNYQRDRTAYNNLSDEALSGLAEPNATHDPSLQADPNEGQQVQSEAPFAVNWEYLKSVNSDVVGWLYCADTRINYPVVQTSDNDYYLHRDFTTRQPNTVGTLFVDYNATLGVNLSNFLIYGHNMKDGSMFAALQHYVDQDYYTQHPVMYFLTPYQNYRIDLIAARIVESSQDNYPNYFQDESAYANYLNTITSSSYFATQAAVTTGYQMVSLSTCDYSGGYNDPRFLVQGLLVPIQ